MPTMQGRTSIAGLLAAAALTTVAALAGGCAGPTLVIRGATVLDPVDRSAKVIDVEVTGGQITAHKPAGRGARGGRQVQARGKFLLPALADMHVHARGNPSAQDVPDQACGTAETARFMLYCGVVAFLDLGSDEARIFALRRRQRAGQVKGADIYAAGSVIGHVSKPGKRLQTTGQHSADGPKRFRAAQDPESGRQHVRALAKLKADVVKVLYDHTGGYMNMPREVLAAIIDEAHRRGLKVVVHIGTWKDAADAVALGVDAVTHLWDEDDIPPALVAQWARQKTWSIPTQPVQVDLPNVLARPGLLDHPLLQRVTTAKLRSDYRNSSGFVPKARFWMRYQGPNAKNYERQLRAMHRGGMPLMAGSDSGNFGVFQGFSLHRELALMVRAGVPAWDALRAGTIAPGRFLGRRFGVRVGDEASLLLLEKDPRRDIRHTTAIAAVVQRGQLVDREELLRGTSVGLPQAVTTVAQGALH